MKRKIYTRIVIDMNTGATLEEESFLWDGPVAECMGGKGGSSMTSVDKDYNRRMANLSEEQQAWARDYFNMWQEHFKPYEIEQVKANRNNLPLENGLYTEQLQAARNLLPYEQDLYRKQLAQSSELLPYQTSTAKQFLQTSGNALNLYNQQLDASQKLLPQQLASTQKLLGASDNGVDLYNQQIAASKELLPQQVEAAKQFFQASTKGVDINERMGLATADAAAAWKNMNEANLRENARLGVNPNSGRFQGTQAALGTQQAAQMAQAKTSARVGAEQENYDRLMKAAAQAQGNVSPNGGLLGLSSLAYGGVAPNTTLTSGGAQANSATGNQKSPTNSILQGLGFLTR